MNTEHEKNLSEVIKQLIKQDPNLVKITSEGIFARVPKNKTKS